MGGSELGNSELGDEVVVVGAVSVEVGVSATQLQNEKKGSYSCSSKETAAPCNSYL